MAASHPIVPSDAQTYYKVVAVTSPTSFVSIYDGTTQYALDRVTAPAGGCWVCPDLLSVIEHSSKLPVQSVRFGAPRAILQVLGWCEDAASLPRAAVAHAALSSTKKLVTHVCPVAILPYTAAGQPGTVVGQEEMLADGIAALGSSAAAQRPRSAPRRPAQLAATGSVSRRTYGGNALLNGRILQAQTASLHEEVLHAQARLRYVSASVTISSDGRPPSAWMRRALERINAPVAPPPPMEPWVVPGG